MSAKKIIKRKNNEFFGDYLMLDLYDCKPETVGNLKICYSFLDTLPKILGVNKLSQPFLIYTDEKKYPDKAGLSGWIPLFSSDNKTFSGASIHTLTPTNFISIDIYSCKKINYSEIKRFIIKIFKPKKVEEKHLLRGKEYKSFQ